MSWQPSPNPYGPPAGQVPPSFPGYPAGALPPGYPAVPPGYPAHSGSPATETYPAGSVYANPPVYPPTAAGQYTYPANPGMNYSAYPTVPPGYPGGAPGMYPSVPPATGGFSIGQAPGGYSYSPQDLVGYVFTPTEHERQKHKIEMKFSPAMDKYIRTSQHGEEVSGWRNLVYAEQNIHRKVEPEWKMSYLARKANTVSGRIEWRFDVASTGHRVTKLRIQFPVKLYEDGYVNAYVATDRGTMAQLAESHHSQEIDAARGCQRFSIIAELARGKGEHAWQHAQLFRQELNPGFFSTDDAHFPFRVAVEFE